MEMKCKPFFLGLTLGIVIPFIPYCFSQKGMNMMDKMKTKMSNVKDSIKEVVIDAKKSTMSNVDGALESINEKIDELIDSLSKIELSKVKTKSKSSD